MSIRRVPVHDIDRKLLCFDGMKQSLSLWDDHQVVHVSCKYDHESLRADGSVKAKVSTGDGYDQLAWVRVFRVFAVSR